MRITDSDYSCPKKQWHPPGHTKEHGPGIALDPAVDFKRVERGTQRRAQQKQPECCPGPLGYCILRVSHLVSLHGDAAIDRLKGETHAHACKFDQIAALSATLILLYHRLASTSALGQDI